MTFSYYLAKKPRTNPGLSSGMIIDFFLLGDEGLELVGELSGVPVGEKVFPLVGLWMTLGVKLEIEPTSDMEPCPIFEKSVKKFTQFSKFTKNWKIEHISVQKIDWLLGL